MPLTSRISVYDARWPAQFAAESKRLAAAFGSELVAIHHIGSTAVPGLSAKPEIDVLVEVSNHWAEPERDRILTTLGYVRGKDLYAGHHFYRRNIEGVRTHKLHVCFSGHPQVERMLRFRDLLRQDATLRQRYQDLKLGLEASNTLGIAEYLQKKAPFIDALVGPPPDL